MSAGRDTLDSFGRIASFMNGAFWLRPSGRMPPPTRAQVEAVFSDLLGGRQSREDVARWAGHWVFADHAPATDPAVWDALVVLGMADLPSTGRPYLYVEEDFWSWLQEFRETCRE